MNISTEQVEMLFEMATKGLISTETCMQLTEMAWEAAEDSCFNARRPPGHNSLLKKLSPPSKKKFDIPIQVC